MQKKKEKRFFKKGIFGSRLKVFLLCRECPKRITQLNSRQSKTTNIVTQCSKSKSFVLLSKLPLYYK